MNLVLLLGAVFGCFSLAAGAYFDHVLRLSLTGDQLNQFLAALHYNQLYAIVITVLGLFALTQARSAIVGRLKVVGWLFILGLTLFSCSIYANVVIGIKELLMVVPVGSGVLMFAWLMLIWAGFAKDVEAGSGGSSNTNKDFYYFKKPSK